MNSTYGKLAIIAVVLVAAGLIAFSGSQSGPQTCMPPPADPAASADMPALADEQAASADTQRSSLPRLVDLGAEGCVPCRMMEPVLEKMGEDFEGQLDVEFINIAENRPAAKKYGVRVIPTQIFFDPSGEEIARHEGFMGREDILRTFEENGVKIPAEDDSG